MAKVYASTNDGRLVMAEGREVWSQQPVAGPGRPLAWSKITDTGLPEGACIVGLFCYGGAGPNTPVVTLATGEAYELRRNPANPSISTWQRVVLPGEEAAQ